MRQDDACRDQERIAGCETCLTFRIPEQKKPVKWAANAHSATERIVTISFIPNGSLRIAPFIVRWRLKNGVWSCRGNTSDQRQGGLRRIAGYPRPETAGALPRIPSISGRSGAGSEPGQTRRVQGAKPMKPFRDTLSRSGSRQPWFPDIHPDARARPRGHILTFSYLRKVRQDQWRDTC